MYIISDPMRLLKASSSLKARVALAFWLFGLINNVLYVIVISAAVDLVTSDLPKGIVLLADILPAFIAKLIAPYFIHVVPYGARIFACAALSASGMLLVAYTSGIPAKLFGIGLASVSSGLGELTFLGLVHVFGSISLAGFGSGTGGAGLVGAGAYALATTTLGLSSRTTITASACLPILMIICFYFLLPGSNALTDQEFRGRSGPILETAAIEEETTGILHDAPESPSIYHDVHASRRSSNSNVFTTSETSSYTRLHANLTRAQKLIYPYMLPLFLVYTAEYVAISGVAPTLLFPLDSSPFRTFRDFYPAYQAIYQTGVFISRSSIMLIRINNIYMPSFLQIGNLVFLILHALFYFLPSVWIIFIIYFWTGLLGGAVYVNAFAKVRDEVNPDEREFSLSATTVADSTGILVASLVSMAVEPIICGYQVIHGREWCRSM